MTEERDKPEASAGLTQQVAMPEIGDGSGPIQGNETVRATIVSAAPSPHASIRQTVPVAPHVPTAVARVVADDLEELDFDAVEEATDPDVAPPAFLDEEVAVLPLEAPIIAGSDGGTPDDTEAAAPELLESDVASQAAALASQAAALPPAAARPDSLDELVPGEELDSTAKASAPPLPSAAEPKHSRRGKAKRRSKKKDRAAQRHRARATARAAGSGPVAEELPEDAIEVDPFFGDAPPLPNIGLFDLPDPKKRRRSRQDMQEILQDFSVMFRMDTKTRRRKSGWVVAAVVVLIAAGGAFVMTRAVPVDAKDVDAAKLVLAYAELSHVGGAVYVVEGVPSDLPAAVSQGTAVTSTEARDARPSAYKAEQRVELSILAVKLARLSKLRAKSRRARSRRRRSRGAPER